MTTVNQLTIDLSSAHYQQVIFECHFHWLISENLSDSIFATNQWGFQHGKSPLAPLLAVVHDWLQALDRAKKW